MNPFYKGYIFVGHQKQYTHNETRLMELENKIEATNLAQRSIVIQFAHVMVSVLLIYCT